MMGEVAVDLTQPALMATIINEGVLGQNIPLIITTGIKMLLLVAVGGFMGIMCAYTASVASQGFGSDLRIDTFQRVMHLSQQQTDKFTTGSLITRLTNDITTVQDLVQSILRMFVRAPMFLIGGLIMCLTLNVNFGYVMLCSIPLQALVVIMMVSKGNPLFTAVQKKIDRVNSVVQENISGARVIKAYTQEDYEMERFDEANKDYRNTNLRVMTMMSSIMPLLMIIMNLAVIAIIYIGGLQAEAQAMDIGGIMAGVQYVSRVLMSIMMLNMIFQQIARGRACAGRIREVLTSEPAIRPGTSTDGKESGSVEFRNVSFSYPGSSGNAVLRDINLTVKRGETLAIIGATGSGKSSLVNLIPRFYDAVEGDVYVDGVHVRDWDLTALRSRISFVLQKSELFSGTVRENIRWGKDDATDEEIRQAAEIAQATEFIESLPDKYDGYIAEKGASLSGGQKQRMAIARAVVRKPSIIIFDDSTSALDLGTEAKLQKALRENLQDTTVIMIAQRIASVMHADRIAVIENGTITACDTHEKLMESSTTYRDIYASQMRNGGDIDG
ncbi:MAG: ABC transporter ATP-binding protein [Ruminococcus sp.]|nr:ABC transporter ATP-binding protein [Clostridia bacterium]MBQ8906520.1 ABC transporter ATP-binding protein [Ruminococcus sp.]